MTLHWLCSQHSTGKCLIVCLAFWFFQEEPLNVDIYLVSKTSKLLNIEFWVILSSLYFKSFTVLLSYEIAFLFPFAVCTNLCKQQSKFPDKALENLEESLSFPLTHWNFSKSGYSLEYSWHKANRESKNPKKQRKELALYDKHYEPTPIPLWPSAILHKLLRN